ncbi:VirD4-like conjugal transfer protein, CD1115 family [Tractidigestivibacter scatoligenes]|uniref:VirD4-like conjugal transfer protein, CD1115 family n=1 Tax=Tractidigestivibacter scatoligenes TaxID=1299998 RepID=UPI000A7A1557|nr:type IV secretory system conjugative DNA transfer family protein [Tractidigestivibacter scatoligenes]
MSAGKPKGTLAAAIGSAAAFDAADLLADLAAASGADPVGAVESALAGLPAHALARHLLPAAGPAQLACGTVAACAVWVAWARALAHSGNWRRGEEGGSARWADAREMRPFADRAHPDHNILLTEGVSLAMSRDDHDARYERNRNVLVVGGSGSGKTRGYVLPNIMQMNASYLVTDPKGTLEPTCGAMLRAHGYRVAWLNTVDFSRSSHYNPLAYVRTQQDVLEFVDCLIENTNGERTSSADPFWENAERLLYTALVGYLVEHCPEADRNLPGLMTLLSLAEARDEDESFMSPLDVLFEELRTGCACVPVREAAAGDGRSVTRGRGPGVRWVPVTEPAQGDFSLSRYHAFKTAAGKTLKSIIISCNARLGKLDSAELREVLSDDDLGLEGMGDPGARVAIFATPSETKSTYNFLYAILAWQCVGRLCDRALVRYGGSLPTPVHLVLDEFCTIGKLPDIQTTIATVRSRNIGMTLVVQSLSQLTARYGEDAETIADCCDTTLFLGGKSTKTNKAISEQVGQQTVSTLSSTESRGPSGGSSRSYQHEARDLIQASEVGRMDRRMAILLVSGCDPVMDRKLSPESHPRAGELSRGALSGGGEGAGRMK